MSALLASLVCVCGIAGLFYLDRDKTYRTSKALWLPVIYLCLSWSRPVSFWLNITPPSGANAQLEGSPLDTGIFVVLLTFAVGVLIRRKSKTGALLAANWPILLYFFYCLVSVTWSYHPGASFKHWIRATSDLAMGLIVVTDARPVAALKRLTSRVGFLLFPTSMLFIKYYATLGRGYSPDGRQMYTGVTTDKNLLGVMVLVLSLCALWQVTTLLGSKGQPDRKRRLTAQSILLAFGVVLLDRANSVTSIACFILGGGLILMMGLRVIKSRPTRVHALCLVIVLFAAFAQLLGGQDAILHALGRAPNLTGRTDIWAAVIPAVPNSVIGAGFESFWIGPDVVKFQRAMVGWWHPENLNEAHNGYIEVYLNLGWIGVCLISLILINGYWRAVGAFRRNPSVGSLMLAYVIVSAVYSITEAGFRSPNPMWIFMLLAIVSSTGVTAGLFSEPVKRERSRSKNSAPMVNAYRSGSVG